MAVSHEGHIFFDVIPSKPIGIVQEKEQSIVESHVRSIAKAVTWRAGGTVVTFAVAWVLTRSFELAAQIGILDTAVKLGAFYAHERIWNRLQFGRGKPPEYQI